jgi:predicted enzyme related to lactoylglutathione lyase
MMVSNRVFWFGISLLTLLLGISCAGRNTPASGGTNVPGTDHTGRFVWQELLTDEIPASQRFYGELFGWQFEESTRLGEPYVLVRKGNRYVGGIVGAEREQPDQPIAQWLSYLLVDDVRQIVERIEQAGGKALVSPTKVDSAGIAAVISDPQGAILGLLQPSKEVPDQPDLGPTGEFFWREYLTPESANALSFYTDTFGYQSEISEESGDMTYHILRRVKPRAGIIKIKKLPVRPNWLPYVRVEDPVVLASKAISLGGQVLLEPHPDARNSSVAIVTDPAGAAIALQKWPY